MPQPDTTPDPAVFQDGPPSGFITVEGRPMAYWLPPHGQNEAPHPDEWPEEGHDDPETETEESLDP